MGDADAVGNLLLGVFPAPDQPEPQPHDDLLPLGQPVDGLQQQVPLNAGFDVAVDRVGLRAEDVRQQQLVAVPVDVQRLVDRHLVLLRLGLAQIHQNLVLDTARSVGGQLDVFFRAEGVDRLNQADGADRGQVLHPDAGRLELFGDVHHQAQVVDNELLARVGFRLGRRIGQTRKHPLLLLARQRGRQRFRAVDIVELDVQYEIGAACDGQRHDAAQAFAVHETVTPLLQLTGCRWIEYTIG